MKTSNSLLLFAFLSFLFSCTKPETLETKHIPATLKQMLPYTNGQTVSYINGSGNTITTTVAMESDFAEKASCTSCDPYVKEEYINYQFIVGSRLLVQLSIDIRPVIFLKIFSPLDNYQVGGGFDFTTVEGAVQPACNGPRQSCLANITLNGKTYTDVLEVRSGATAPNQLTKAYYTVSKGLIGFAYGNGIIYSLHE